MRTPTRDKLARVAGGDQEIILFLEDLAKGGTTSLSDGNYGDITVVGGQMEINPGVVGLTEVSAQVLNRANQTGTQAIATVSGLQPALDGLQAGVSTAQGGVNALTVVVAGKQAAMGFVTVSPSFGATFSNKAQVVVTGQTWVTAGSKIIAQVVALSGTDPDEIFLLGFRTVISDLVAGVGFTLTLYSEPQARGSYTVNCIGY
jgi:hypothetical protein